MEGSVTSQIEQKKVALHTLGCRLNFSETGTIAGGFTERGYALVPFGDKADVVFINTCTVTDQADSSCRNLIRKAHRSSPDGQIVVAGCYAQMEAETIAKMQGVDLVLGTQEKYKVFDFLEDAQKDIIHIDTSNDFWGANTTISEGHTRAFLKIQDGCNYICSFCIIPFARGRSRAISIHEATAKAETLAAQGFKEIILTGVNIGEYEHKSGEKLSNLLAAIDKIDGIERIRLSSVEPNTITDELLEVMKSSPKFLDHFHVPLQSADPEILESMRRKYTIEKYGSVISKIKDAFPEAAIGADIITGYPGESEEQFEQTFEYLKSSPITHFHVFPFSSRKGTTAAGLEGRIQSGEKKRRVKTLIGLGEFKLAEFSRKLIGKKCSVLFERENQSGYFEGYTSNFVRVWVKSSQDLKNQIFEVLPQSFSEGHLTGELLQ